MNNRNHPREYLLESNGQHSKWFKNHIVRSSTLFHPIDCGQEMLQHKLNIYLAMRKRPLLLLPGYCHGITLLWLTKMAEGREQWFYDIAKKIATWSPYAFQYIEKDIEMFLEHIEWAQDSGYHTRQLGLKPIDQDNPAAIMEAKEIASTNKFYSYPDLFAFFQKQLNQKEMIVVSSWEWMRHTVGVFVSGPHFYMFDPLNPSGMPKIYASPKPLIDELEQRLYDPPARPRYYMPLELHVLKAPEMEHKKQVEFKKPGL